MAAAVQAWWSRPWVFEVYLEDGIPGLGSVVRITPIYKPLKSHLEGVPQPDP